MSKVKNYSLLVVTALLLCVSFVVGGIMLSGNTEKVNAEVTGTFEMVETASAPINTKGGLRFRVKMDETVKDSVDDDTNPLSIVIFTKEVYDAGVDKEKTDSEILEAVIANDVFVEIKIPKESIYEEDGFWYGNAVLDEIEKPKVNFVAFGKLGEDFTENHAWNNLYNVINSAFNDPEEGITGKILNNDSYSWYGNGRFPVVVTSQDELDLLLSRVSNDDVSIRAKGFDASEGVVYDLSKGGKQTYELDEEPIGDLTTNIEGFKASCSGTTLTVENESFGGGNANGLVLRVSNGNGFDKLISLIDYDKTDASLTSLNLSLDRAIIKNPEDAYKDGVYLLTRDTATKEVLGKTAIGFTGTNEGTWRNNLLIDVGVYKEDFKWILVDFYFNSDTVMFTYDNSVEYDSLTYGKPCDNGTFYVVRESDGVYYNVSAVKTQWITVAFRTDKIKGNYIDAIMSNAVETYVSNIRAVKASVLDEVSGLPDTWNIPLDNADVNKGADYNMVRDAAPAPFEGQLAYGFTSNSSTTWTDNLLINVGAYKVDYDWILVDFYLNSDDVRFDVVGTVNDYAYLTFGDYCKNGSFYVISNVEGTYYSVPALKGQWITIAFKTSDIRNEYINGIMSNEGKTYVSNIRAVKDSVIGTLTEYVVKLPDFVSISNSTITNQYSGGMLKEDNVNMYSRSGLVHLTALVDNYQAQWEVYGLNNLRSQGYKYVAIDMMYNDQGTGVMPQVWYLNDAITIPLNGIPSNSALKLYDVAHKETTLGSGFWTTFVFDLSASAQDWVGFFTNGGRSGCDWYVDTITAMTEDGYDEFLKKPAKVEADTLGLVTTANFAKSSVGTYAGKDGVTKFSDGDGGVWHTQVAYVYTNQYVAAGYNTFSVDLYLDAETNLWFYYYNNSDSTTLYTGSVSGADGIQILDEKGESTTLEIGKWVTLKFDITKVSAGAIYIFRNNTGANMYMTNAYYENVEA